MRVDAKRNLKKVATEAIKNPLQTEQEIADATGLSTGNVHDKLRKLKEAGELDRTSTVVVIEETDLQLVSLAQSKALEWMEMMNEPKREDIAVANQVARESQKRYSIFAGANTDKDGGEVKFEVVNYAEIKDG